MTREDILHRLSIVIEDHSNLMCLECHYSIESPDSETEEAILDALQVFGAYGRDLTGGHANSDVKGWNIFIPDEGESGGRNND